MEMTATCGFGKQWGNCCHDWFENMEVGGGKLPTTRIGPKVVVMRIKGVPLPMPLFQETRPYEEVINH